jgi:O-antigen ligase
MVAFPLWVLLVDPDRADDTIGRRLRLAGLLVLAAPGRMGGLGLVLALILIVSTVAFAALLTVSVAYAALVAARFVLPMADRFEAWLDDRAGSDDQRR